MKRAEYLIVGMGIAGASLAIELISRNKRILVTDNYDPNSASRVAAGMFNPVTSKVRNFTWMADQLFPYLDNFYRSAEKLGNILATIARIINRVVRIFSKKNYLSEEDRKDLLFDANEKKK